MKRVVVLSGAGISAESGLQTFRGADGLWEGLRVEDVATPEAWAANPGLVLDFYNQRRRAVRAAEPNAAHRALVDLERAYDVRVVTQNVDDLHERAGSTQVPHLHGEVMLARSPWEPRLVRHLRQRGRIVPQDPLRRRIPAAGKPDLPACLDCRSALQNRPLIGS